LKQYGCVARKANKWYPLLIDKFEGQGMYFTPTYLFLCTTKIRCMWTTLYEPYSIIV